MGCFVIVPEDRVAVIETCGAFDKTAGPGFHCLGIPGVCTVRGRLSTRVRPLTTHCETKTKDNVFLLVVAVTQYRIIKEDAQKVLYSLDNPEAQMKTYVVDVVRASVPKMTVDKVFESKDDIAKSIYEQLKEEMEGHGFQILNTLIVDVKPDPYVKASMNEVEAQKRLRMAAEHRAEADKIKVVKAAEGQAESSYLSGVGIANASKRVVEGLESSVLDFKDTVGTDPETTMNLLLSSQYFDTIKEVSKGKNAKAIFYNEVDDNGETDKLRNAILQANAVSRRH